MSKKPDKSYTKLYSGEQLHKSDKIFASIGTIEELTAYIGIIKATHYISSDSSAKMFLFARLTQIQETLIEIMHSLGTTKKQFKNMFGDEMIKDIEKELEKFAIEKTYDRPYQLISGNSLIEANFLYARSLCRRAERQICASKNTRIGIIPEDNIIIYLNKLGDYFLCLALNK